MKIKGIMDMKLRTIRRHIREGFKNIYRNGWMTIASIGAVTMTLILVGVFLALILNLNQIANKIEEDVEMKVFIDLTADEDDIKQLGEEIDSHPEVDTLKFSSNRSEEHTSELQSRGHLVCRLLLEKKKI